jgi:hypothetical protein
LLGIPDRRRGRSKYGAEKPKSIWMEDASGTCFSRSVEGTTLRPKIELYGALPNEKEKKALSFVGKIYANIILTFSRPTSKDR